MRRLITCRSICLPLFLLALSTSGCGGFLARRMAQAPNSYPAWLAPRAPVELAFAAQFLTNFPAHFAEVGPPPARLRYRIVDPANYRFAVNSTNWMEHGKPRFKFTFLAKVPGLANAWTGKPRGTVVLLHGHALGQFAMAPWALRLAEEGWRCVLVDLRGHGKSTGRQIYFGLRETRDLSQLLDILEQGGSLRSPVTAFGESYGASLALRWKTLEPRVDKVIAITPYAELANAAMNLRREYAKWIPPFLIRAGLRRLPSLLETDPGELDTITVLNRGPVAALFIAAGGDKITPEADVRKLYEQAAPGSRWITVPAASHEAVTYYFDPLTPEILAWLLQDDTKPGPSIGTPRPE